MVISDARPVSAFEAAQDDYNAIREATAVEDGRSPLATEALVEFAKNVLRKQNRETLATLKTDDTVTISIAAMIQKKMPNLVLIISNYSTSL